MSKGQTKLSLVSQVSAAYLAKNDETTEEWLEGKRHHETRDWKIPSLCLQGGEWNGRGPGSHRDQKGGWGGVQVRDDGGLDWWGSGGQLLSKNLTAYLLQSGLSRSMVSRDLNS